MTTKDRAGRNGERWKLRASGRLCLDCVTSVAIGNTFFVIQIIKPIFPIKTNLLAPEEFKEELSIGSDFSSAAIFTFANLATQTQITQSVLFLCLPVTY